MRARFGTAGNPDGFYQAGKKQSKDMPPWLREQGLEAYEYQCGKGVTVGEEVLAICAPSEGLLPCVDFGHLYARSLGALDGAAAVEGMLDRMVQVLGEARARVFHSHFSKIEYTPRGGEARHLTFDQPYFGPDYHPLCQALARRGWAPRVICESAGTQDVDALAMQRAYRQALGEGP